ncbi:MAG: hypothetical protein IT428_06090 [Planctomycetaceae bacterium]|nr:hypothetical protein [Planctomycetaceae bacterium]
MNVRDWIARLQKFNGDEPVVLTCEDANIRGEGRLFRLFDIDDIQITEGQLVRGDDGIPSVKIGRSSDSQSICAIDITADF